MVVGVWSMAVMLWQLLKLVLQHDKVSGFYCSNFFETKTVKVRENYMQFVICMYSCMYNICIYNTHQGEVVSVEKKSALTEEQESMQMW